MYTAYGWPKILEVSNGREEETIVHVSVGGGLLVIVSSTCIQIWTASQHRIRVGEYVRDTKSIEEDGCNVQALWNARIETLSVLTGKNVIHFYDVNGTDKRLRLLGPDFPSLFLVRVKFRNSTNIPLFGDDIVIGGLVADDDNILVGLTNGRLHLISWRGQLRGTTDMWKQNSRGILGPMFLPEANGLSSSPISPSVNLPPFYSPGPNNERLGDMGVAQLEYSEPLGLLVVVLLDGRVILCSNAEKGLRPVQAITPEKWVGVADAVCAAISTQQQVLAVGTRRGTVELFNLTDNAAYMRTVSLVDWGYSLEDTGHVTCICWSPDNWAFAVGWRHRGLAVWSVSGCRLMCTIRQGSLSHQHIQSPAVGHGTLPKTSEPLAYGVSVLAWGEYGYQLLAAEHSNSTQLMQFSFARGCLNKAVAGSANLWQIMQAEDRIVLIQSDEEDELKLQHLVIPQTYMASNWPVMHVTANDDGSYLAIAGRRGVILYNLRLKKWRVFGDVMQERAVQCTGLLWLGKIVVICSHREATDSYELSLYPRYHLDESSLLFRQQLPAKPLALDSWQDYILVATPPFEVRVFHMSLDGELSPLKHPSVQLRTVRELSLMSARRPIVSMRFVPRSGEEEWDASHQPGLMGTSPITDVVRRQPTRCMILRTDGDLSLLDLDSGSERPLVSGVEHFWITKGRPREEAALIEEVPWWAYGHRGMQVWYPSQHESASLSASPQQLDPELDFDREVYPLGVSPAAGVIVGISQRLSISACSDLPCFEPSPQAQPILPCLLRHLLQRDKLEEAVELAGFSANRPHFSHSLEWLLFTVFDAEMASQHGKKNRGKVGTPMLDKACELVRRFPEYLDVVVSVARKTDSRHWAELFAAAGVSTQLFEECFDRKQYRTATCYILVIDKLEGPTIGQKNALRLLQATLQVKLYELAGELVRFLVRSGREFSSTEREDDTSSESLLKSFFSFGFTSAAPKVRADVLHTTVKNILADHALHLLAMKELRELVAFARGTQFDLKEFLRAQEGNAVRLEDFPTALKIIRLKLGSDGSQSRTDAEFLLEQMQAVGFLEWTVVLATLLRDTNVLLELFRNDLQLWLAYEKTMKVQINASHYDELLQTLRAKLSDNFDHQSIPLLKDT